MEELLKLQSIAKLEREVISRKLVTVLLRPNILVNICNHLELPEDCYLHKACQHGYLRLARILVQHSDVDIMEQDHNLWTPLHFAAHFGHLEICKLLLRCPGIDPSIVEREDGRPIDWAVNDGPDQLEIVKLLFAAEEIDINKISWYHDHALLHQAMSDNVIEIAKFFLEKDGIDVNIQGKERKCTPLHYAAQEEVKVCQLMLEQDGINVALYDDDMRTPLHYAARSGCYETWQMLKQLGMYDEQRSLLLDASWGCNAQICQEIIDLDQTYLEVRDEDGKSALHRAVGWEINMDVWNLLLIYHPIEWYDPEMTILMTVLRAREGPVMELCKQLIAYNPEYARSSDGNGRTPLHYVKTIEQCQLMLDHGADINAHDDYGHTPLDCAWYKNMDIFKFLLEQDGIGVNCQDDNSTSILSKSIWNDTMDYFKLLLERDDIVITEKIIKDAFNSRNYEFSKLLLEKGIEVPPEMLILAISRKNNEVVQMLLERGMTVTPDMLSVAISSRNNEVVQLLLEKNEDIITHATVASAIRHKNTELVQTLIEKGNIDINEEYNGKTLLVESAIMVNVDVCKLLLDMGANVNHVTDNYGTALHFGVLTGNTELCQLLLSVEGIDLTVANKNGLTVIEFGLGSENVGHLFEPYAHLAPDPEPQIESESEEECDDSMYSLFEDM